MSTSVTPKLASSTYSPPASEENDAGGLAMTSLIETFGKGAVTKVMRAVAVLPTSSSALTMTS